MAIKLLVMESHRRPRVSSAGSPEIPSDGRLARKISFLTLGRQVKSIFWTELYRDVEVVEDKKKFTVPAITAIAQKMVGKAVAGDPRVAQMMLEMGLRFESEERKEYERFVRIADVYLRLWDEHIELATRCNQPVAHPRPDPSQFVMELNSGLLTIKGPMTDAEAASGIFDDDTPTFTQAVARRFIASMKLPPGHDIRNYIRD